MAETKTVIVTGAGSGIGAATAKRFSSDGWNVVLNGRTRPKLEKIARDLPDARTLIVEGDVSRAEDAQLLVDQAVDKFGRLDALINNAGVASMGVPGELSLEDFEKMMSVNVSGIFNTVTPAVDHLIMSKGSIVNVSSVSGLGGDWKMFGYNASKGAVSNMTRAMAMDLGSSGVRVNAVAPSLTRTDMSQGIFKNDRLQQKFMDRIPMGRPGEPEDGGLSASNGQPNFD